MSPSAAPRLDVPCENCGARLLVPAESPRKKTKCPKCGALARLPEPEWRILEESPPLPGYYRMLNRVFYYPVRNLSGILFLLVMTPLGLFFRLIGRDALKLRIERDRASYWEPKAQPAGATIHKLTSSAS